METKDLIGIGRLGGRDGDGYYHAMFKPGYKSVCSGLAECFLIFNSDRVFFVTISDCKTVDKKTYIRFQEAGIDEERPLHKEVIIAIDAISATDDDPDSEEFVELSSMLGFTVIHEDICIGTLEDFFFNNAQYVLIIKTEAGKEILVPYVPYFVSAVVRTMQMLFLQNATELIDL